VQEDGHVYCRRRNRYVTLMLQFGGYFTPRRTSGVTIGRARRAVHAGPALWGAQNLPDAVFDEP